MAFPRRILVLALFGLIAIPAAAAAQDAAPVKLVAGTWTGTVIPPDGATDVTYEVSYSGDTLNIVLVAGQHGRFPLHELAVTATKISFSFTPGPRVVCALTADDKGAYSGDCTDDGGLVVPMTMVPPSKDAPAGGSGS